MAVEKNETVKPKTSRTSKVVEISEKHHTTEHREPMESLSVKCPIAIKAKVTEALKNQMAAEIQENIKKADVELQQIDFQGKKILNEQAKVDVQALPHIQQQIEAEKQKRNEFKSAMVERLKEVAGLEIGSEIMQGTLEQVASVSVGTDLHKLMSTELLVEDGKVIAIRN